MKWCVIRSVGWSRLTETLRRADEAEVLAILDRHHALLAGRLNEILSVAFRSEVITDRGSRRPFPLARGRDQQILAVIFAVVCQDVSLVSLASMVAVVTTINGKV